MIEGRITRSQLPLHVSRVYARHCSKGWLRLVLDGQELARPDSVPFARAFPSGLV